MVSCSMKVKPEPLLPPEQLPLAREEPHLPAPAPGAGEVRAPGQEDAAGLGPQGDHPDGVPVGEARLGERRDVLITVADWSRRPEVYLAAVVTPDVLSLGVLLSRRVDGRDVQLGEELVRSRAGTVTGQGCLRLVGDGTGEHENR